MITFSIKSIILAVIVLAALLQIYFGFLLAPLSRREDQAETTLAEVAPKIASMQALQRTQAELERKAPELTAQLEQLRATVPAGEPLAWFPPRIMRSLRKQGVPRAKIQLSNIAKETSEFHGFRRLDWTIDIPQTGFIALGAAVAEIENTEPLLGIRSVRIEASPTDPEFQAATLFAETLITE